MKANDFEGSFMESGEQQSILRKCYCTLLKFVVQYGIVLSYSLITCFSPLQGPGNDKTGWHILSCVNFFLDFGSSCKCMPTCDVCQFIKWIYVKGWIKWWKKHQQFSHCLFPYARIYLFYQSGEYETLQCRQTCCCEKGYHQGSVCVHFPCNLYSFSLATLYVDALKSVRGACY